jgi:hypothetical protein
LDPQLRGDEQLIAGDPAGGDGPADSFLVPVGGCGIEVAVAGGEGFANGLLSVFRRDLIGAEAEDRHLDAVVEGDRLHGGSFCG